MISVMFVLKKKLNIRFICDVCKNGFIIVNNHKYLKQIYEEGKFPREFYYELQDYEPNERREFLAVD